MSHFVNDVKIALVVFCLALLIVIGLCHANGPVRYMKACPYENPKVEEGDFFFLYTDHYDHVAYLSPDMPTYLSFGQWTGIKKNFPEIYLILDVPIEVTIHGGRFVTSINTEEML
ncbi:MAG: hypothetical protein MRK02_15905 [Candidatus Scalindua sp.]|nr:hypothetical protein [Candidatus Scalindua sp.]